MGEGDEDVDPASGPPPNKKYCCGNETDGEAIKISGLEMVSCVGQIGTFASPLVLNIVMPNFLKNLAIRQEYQDLVNFLELDTLYIWAVLATLIVYSFFGIILGVMLFVGAKERDWRKLRKWFFLHVLHTLVFVGIAIPVTTFVGPWMKYCGWFVFIFLYKWYALWIVYLLIGEIKEVAGRYVHPGGI